MGLTQSELLEDVPAKRFNGREPAPAVAAQIPSNEREDGDHDDQQPHADQHVLSNRKHAVQGDALPVSSSAHAQGIYVLSQMLINRSPPGEDRVKGDRLGCGGCTALAEAKMYSRQFGTHSQGRPERNVVVAGPVRPPIMV